MSVGKVYALCLRLLADQELAEKLTVEAYLITWRNISFFREDVLFSSWLTGITTHEILEWIRNNGKKWNDLDQKDIRYIRENLNSKIVVPFEFSIQSLPSEERFVFVLHDVEKYTEDEVAALPYIFLHRVRQKQTFLPKVMNFNTKFKRNYNL